MTSLAALQLPSDRCSTCALCLSGKLVLFPVFCWPLSSGKQSQKLCSIATHSNNVARQ